MGCSYPIFAFRSEEVNPDTGKQQITFDRAKAYVRSVDDILELPCGECLQCRLSRSRTWALRCLMESELYDHNCFITLTYNKANIPARASECAKCWITKEIDGKRQKVRRSCYGQSDTLCIRDFQLFIKSLRKRFKNIKIRFFMCGEYGSLRFRPHYHACLFNFDFPDKEMWSYEKNGSILYRSSILESLWTKGYSTVGDVTFESAAYVARYILKKSFGKDATDAYKNKCPEFTTMSRRPGLSRGWYDLYSTDVYPNDFIVAKNGVRLKPPRYFDNIFSLTNKAEFDKIKSDRMTAARESPHNNPKRRHQIEEFKKEQVKLLKRSYENDFKCVQCL
jgi:hypothetical protein